MVSAVIWDRGKGRTGWIGEIGSEKKREEREKERGRKKIINEARSPET